MTPQDARLGRWILLYGLLQVLSTLSVDTLGLKYKEGVDYFVSPSLKKCPPWGSSTRSAMTEASQTESYCWRAPDRWANRTSHDHIVASEKKSPSRKISDELDGDANGEDNAETPTTAAFTEEEFPDQVLGNSARRADEQMRQAFEHMYVDKVKYMNMEKSQMQARQLKEDRDQKKSDDEQLQRVLRAQQDAPNLPPRSPLRAPAAIPEVPEREQGAYFAGRAEKNGTMGVAAY